MKTLSRNDIIVRNRKIAVAFIIIIAVSLAFIFFSTYAAAENSRELHTYYTSYEIESGDTLWTIADKFMTPEYSDKATFKKKKKKLNHISSDNITAGNYLVIEYLAYEEL